MHICVCLRVISIEVCWNWNHTPQIPITVHQPAGSGTNTQKREDPREMPSVLGLVYLYVFLCFSRARFRSCVHVMCTAHTSHTRTQISTQTHRQGMAHAISITVCVGTRCVPSVATRRVVGSQDLQTPFFITQHTPTCDLGGGAAYLTLTSR